MRNTPMPLRGNLVGECVRVIRLRLADGEWSGGLPGERTLARALEVGRDTVRLALQQLEHEQVLGPAQPGSKREVLVERSKVRKAPSKLLRIGILSRWPLEQLPQPTLFEIDALRRVLADSNGRLDFFAPSWFEQRDPSKNLEQLVKDESCSAWLLFRASGQVQRWFADSGVPCLVRGYPVAENLLPHLDVDWEATARHAAGRLWRYGHRTIGILVPADQLRGVTAAVHGACSLGEPGFEVLELDENGTTEGLCRALARALQMHPPPTAIIATRPRQVATVLTWLGTQGIRVPQDFGIVSLAHEPFLDVLVPSISGYRVDPEAVSKQLIRRLKLLISGLSGQVGNSWITPEVIKGDSIREGV